MPLYIHRKIEPAGELGIWLITEPEGYFLAELDLFPLEKELLRELKGHRKLEWLAGRWLLHYMSGRADRGALWKDKYGKPHLENSPFLVSLSHSREMAAVAASPDAVGVDIQKIVTKIDRIAHKFMREEEKASLEIATNIAHLHVYWGAKEALYKAYGRKELDFRQHIHIQPFSFDLENGTCTGKIIKGDFAANYQIWYEQIGEFILVYCIEI